MLVFSVAVLVMTIGLISGAPVPNTGDSSSVPLDSEEQLRSLTSKEDVVDAKITENIQQTQRLEQHKENEDNNIVSVQQNEDQKNVQSMTFTQKEQKEQRERQQEENQNQQQQQEEQKRQQSKTQQQSQKQKPETQALPTVSNADVDELVSKINDNIRSRYATMTLCRKVHGVYFKGKCIIAKDNIEMVIGSVFSDNLKQDAIPKGGFVGFGNPGVFQG